MKCPGCPLELPDDDLHAQRAHMTEFHQDIVDERNAESARWDGWVNDG